MVGLAAAAAGASVVLCSDFAPAVVENLRYNLAVNTGAGGGVAASAALDDWRDYQTPADGGRGAVPPVEADVVLGSALVYGPHHAAPLACCLAAHLRRPTAAGVPPPVGLILQRRGRPGFARLAAECAAHGLAW